MMSSNVGEMHSKLVYWELAYPECLKCKFSYQSVAVELFKIEKTYYQFDRFQYLGVITEEIGGFSCI